MQRLSVHLSIALSEIKRSFWWNFSSAIGLVEIFLKIGLNATSIEFVSLLKHRYIFGEGKRLDQTCVMNPEDFVKLHMLMLRDNVNLRS